MATVFQAEIFAIGQAAHHITHNRDLLNNIRDIDIITDSKSALMALDGICTPSKIVMDCMKSLDTLQESANVTIHWTKAHVGHEGNERADSLAKEGTTKISHQVEPIIPVPKSWIKRKINQYLHNEWSNRWNSISEARQTKIFFPQPSSKLSKKLLTYDRRTCGKLFRWITGHSFHRYHNHLTTPELFNNPQCRVCNSSREETSHLYAYCTGLAPTRMRLWGKDVLTEGFTWTPNQLLAMINEVDKICPEENSFEPQTADQRQNSTEDEATHE
jgi:ribonuclease HI